MDKSERKIIYWVTHQSECWNVVMLSLGALGSGLLVMIRFFVFFLFFFFSWQGVKGLAFEPNQLQGVYISLVHVLVLIKNSWNTIPESAFDGECGLGPRVCNYRPINKLQCTVHMSLFMVHFIRTIVLGDKSSNCNL